MTIEQMKKEILLAMKYSKRVSGSCNHAYMGSITYMSLCKILQIEYGKDDLKIAIKEIARDPKKWHLLIKAHTCIEHYVPLATNYFLPTAILARIKQEFE